MPVQTKELSPAREIANQSLDDENFQSGLAKAGFTLKDTEDSIKAFREDLPVLPLTPTQRKVIDIMEPFGQLTTLRRIAISLSYTDEKARSWFSSIRNTIVTNSTSPVAERLDQTKNHSFKGIGCENPLNPTMMALTYLIYTQNGTATRLWLAEQVFPDTFRFDKELAEHYIVVGLSKLRWHLPEGVALTKGQPGRSKIHSFRWINAFED